MKTRLLVVEDDASIRLGLQELLASEGFEVSVCTRGDRVLETVRREAPGLILLDIMLPRLNGYEVCRLLRQSGIPTPILMLTAKGQELDKVVGLDSGADDYVTKPFGVRELLARIHALLRRVGSGPPGSGPGSNPGGGNGNGGGNGKGTDSGPGTGPPSGGVLRIGVSEIDPRTFELRREGQRFDLTPRELRLLQLFVGHPGEVLSRDRLLTEVWGQRYLGTTRTLDQVIVQLRRKLGDSADAPRHLLTVHGVGYRLNP